MEWKKVKISDIATLINGRAYAQPELLYEGKYRIVRVGNLSGGDNWFFSNMELGEDKYCNEGDLLYAWACNFGPFIWHGDKTIFHYHIWKMILDESLANKSYLYYYLKYITPYWLGNVNGSVMVHITKGTMEKQELPLPPLETQRRIAAILSSLDDKIENNNRINRNLEAQAQALFKSWFVDFEPWGGTMPDDWREYRLGDFVPVKTGKKDANVASKTGLYPFFSCAQDILYTDNYSFNGDAILVAGNGDFNVKWYRGKFEAYQRTYVLIPTDSRFLGWLFYLVKYNLDRITSGARGSVIKFITKGNLEDFVFVAPKELKKCDIIDKFNSINAMIEQNKNENSRLAALRDTLLPKLMKGEIEL